MPPGLLPRFYSTRWFDTEPRYTVDWGDNGATRWVSLELGIRQLKLVWTRKAYRR